MYLLDTDHVVILQTRPQGDFERLVDRMRQYPANDFHVPIVAFHEQMLGWNAYISRAKDSAGVVRGYGVGVRSAGVLSRRAGVAIRRVGRRAVR